MIRLLSLLFIFSNLFAQDFFTSGIPADRAWTSSLDDFLIGGLINPANGGVSLFETDLIADGVQPLSLTRYYTVRKSENGSDYFYLQKERLQNGRLIAYTYDQNHAVISVESLDPSGQLTYASLRKEGNSWVTHTGQRMKKVLILHPLQTENITWIMQEKHTRGGLLSFHM